jgi:NTP pyrophosphatase (non-canonical NTP hydrolase)
MDLSELTEEMHRFVGSKGWYGPESPKKQTPRNLAISLAVESAEVLELFQWSEGPVDRNLLEPELADIALYLLQLASITKIDLEEAILGKLRENYGRDWSQESGNRDQA